MIIFQRVFSLFFSSSSSFLSFLLSFSYFFFKYIHTRWLKNRPVQCKKGTWSNRETLNAMTKSRMEEINSFEIQPASFPICVRFYIYIYISIPFHSRSHRFRTLSNVSEHKIDDWYLSVIRNLEISIVRGNLIIIIPLIQFKIAFTLLALFGYTRTTSSILPFIHDLINRLN